MIDIKFRAKSHGWVYGDLHVRSSFAHIHTDLGTRANIDVATIGQYMGLKD